MVRILNSLSIDMVKIPNKNYEMGKYPVTIAEYMHFVNNVQKYYPKWKEEAFEYYKEMNLTDNTPIMGISWYDATEYCKWLIIKTRHNYRLPTEKEWEYSARAGTTTRWSFGDDSSELKKYAWYNENSNGTTHEVGKKLPNPWGLYDMYGNVWEWCEDWYDKDKKSKVLRGGSWFNYSDDHTFYHPALRDDDRGFRLLRTLPS